MKITAIGDFPDFTKIFHFCRPKESDLSVFEVDTGLPTDYNLVMKAAVIQDNQVSGDVSELILSKEWILDNMAAIIGEEEVSKVKEKN